MAKLYITEYAETRVLVAGQVVQCPLEPPAAEQVVDFTGGVAQSSAFQNITTFIRLHTDSTCSVLIGTNPTATTGSGRMAANQTEFRGIRDATAFGATSKVSVIINS